MRVYGMGVLILGKSSIGRSECALDLITRGHALVADDLVEINLQGRKKVIGAAPELLRHIIEVRGLGIMNIMELYGAEAVAESTEIDLVAEFLDMEQFKEMDRTGLIRWTYTLADADIPLYRIPVSQNRNIAIIMEVAVRNHLLVEKRHIARGSSGKADREPVGGRRGDFMNNLPILIITGLSGSGKTTVAKVLEDLGFFCLDNMPIVFLPNFLELRLSSASEISKVAIVIDIRSGEFLEEAPRIIEEMKGKGHKVDVLFLDCDEKMLLRRYSETRRTHPLDQKGRSPLEAIREERERLSALRAISPMK